MVTNGPRCLNVFHDMDFGEDYNFPQTVISETVYRQEIGIPVPNAHNV